MGKVTMHNPRSGVTQEASADAFERVWKGEGWQLVAQPEPVPQPDPNAAPTGTIADVLAWVGDDKDKAGQALAVEQAKGDKARSTLVAELEQLAADEGEE